MTIMTSVELPIAADKWDDTLAAFEQALKDTRAREGLEKLDTYLDEENHVILLIEHWAEKADQEAYMAWRMETGFMEQVGPLLAGEPQFRDWQISEIGSRGRSLRRVRCWSMTGADPAVVEVALRVQPRGLRRGCWRSAGR